MQQYKINVGLLTSRYNDFEQRMLVALQQGGEPGANGMQGLPGGMDIFVTNLVKDGLILYRGHNGVMISGVPARVFYELTAKGKDVVTKWFNAEAIDASAGEDEN